MAHHAYGEVATATIDGRVCLLKFCCIDGSPCQCQHLVLWVVHHRSLVAQHIVTVLLVHHHATNFERHLTYNGRLIGVDVLHILATVEAVNNVSVNSGRLFANGQRLYIHHIGHLFLLSAIGHQLIINGACGVGVSNCHRDGVGKGATLFREHGVCERDKSRCLLLLIEPAPRIFVIVV